MSDAEPIAIVPKNSREEVRVDLTEFKGHNLVDIRVFADDGSKQTATKKGISLAIAKLPALIDALRKAETEARRRGLIAQRERVETADGDLFSSY